MSDPRVCIGMFIGIKTIQLLEIYILMFYNPIISSVEQPHEVNRESIILILQLRI